MKPQRPIVIVGGGGHARVLISSLKASRRKIIGILDAEPTRLGRSVSGVPILGGDEKIREYPPEAIDLVNGIGSVASTEKRKSVYARFKKLGYSFATVVHPTAIVVEDGLLGEGAQIMAGAIVQAGGVIRENAIVNTGAIVDHDCIIGAHAHLAPGVVLSGGVRIGDQAHIGTAAAVIQDIHIGENSVIGAGAVVVNDIPPGVTAVGVPARIIKKGE